MLRHHLGLTNLIEELIQQFDIDKHGGRIRQFVGNDIKESFGTQNIALRSSTTPLGLERGQAELENI